LGFETKNIIIVSAVNLVEGGPLTVLKDFLSCLAKSPIAERWRVIALVHDKQLALYNNIEYIEYPASKKHWLNRIFYEYIWFYFVSRKLRPDYWISLHDVTPNVAARHRIVYIHNPSAFYQGGRIGLLGGMWKYTLFMLFYKYLYQINIKKNDYIVVQQEWFREGIARQCGIDRRRIIVAYPQSRLRLPLCSAGAKIVSETTNSGKTHEGNEFMFFYPAFPRPFKNFELICEAAEMMIKTTTAREWKVVLTIDGSENNYSRRIVEKFAGNKRIQFIGLVSNENMADLYEQCDCLIFPSRLETWGLPVSEFKAYGKPMILADMAYSHESAGGAAAVAYFNPDSTMELLTLMQAVINGDFSRFKKISTRAPEPPFCGDWESLIDFLIRD